MDARNMLKPQLARGELRTIGATTLDEYRKYIEKDAALERRFQPVMVDEPSVEDTIAILRGLKERYEVHHGVRIQDAALVAAAMLSHRYITDRFLPDKAVDLDGRSGLAPARSNSIPCRRRSTSSSAQIMQLEMERQALKKGKGRRQQGAPRQAREGTRRSARKERASSRPSGRTKRRVIDEQRKLQEQLEQLQASNSSRPSAAAISTKASEIQYGRIPELQQQLEEHNAKLAEMPEGGRQMLKEEVTDDDIAEVVSALDRHPRFAACSEGEREKLVKMEERLGAARHRPEAGHQRRRQRRPPRPRAACRTRTAPSAPSFSSARPASAKPSWPARWPNSSSTTRTP